MNTIGAPKAPSFVIHNNDDLFTGIPICWLIISRLDKNTQKNRGSP